MTKLARFWLWVDQHEVDKHFVSLAILWGTVKVTEWAMVFAGTYPDKYMAIAAVTTPYCALQAAAIKFYFDNRTPPAGGSQ
jgi:hypothetical protein